MLYYNIMNIMNNNETITKLRLRFSSLRNKTNK